MQRFFAVSFIGGLFLFLLLLPGRAGTVKGEVNKCILPSTFPKSLATYLNGTLKEENQYIEEGRRVNSSVILIPTYYGYHSFLGVLDSYILNHTDITSLRTWRLAENNIYVILLTDNHTSVRILYDPVNSLLLLTAPVGY